jgi:hypothetical protein
MAAATRCQIPVAIGGTLKRGAVCLGKFFFLFSSASFFLAEPAKPATRHLNLYVATPPRLHRVLFAAFSVSRFLLSFFPFLSSFSFFVVHVFCVAAVGVAAVVTCAAFLQQVRNERRRMQTTTMTAMTWNPAPLIWDCFQSRIDETPRERVRGT